MKRSRSTNCCVMMVLLCGLGLAAIPPALATEFTYQGQLKNDGAVVNDDYEFIFRLYDAETGGAQIGSDFPVTAAVDDGLFTVQLDFGTGAFDGNPRWLEIAVRRSGNTSPHTTLSPRQPVTATPVAMYALDGPGSGGLWAQNGNDIYNTNTGRVGVRTLYPEFNLHVYDMVPSGTNQPPTTFGVQWQQAVIPTPPDEWFYFAVGGSAPTIGSGTRMIRESGTELHFQTQDEMKVGWPSTQMMLDASGNLGLGTDAPLAKVETVSTGVHGVRASSDWIPITALRTSSSGSWPAIHAESESSSTNTAAIRAYLTSDTLNSGAAAVRGQINSSTTMFGYGVEGRHSGYGIGVYGVSTNGTGVYGESTNGGYAGYFNGTVAVDVLEISGADVAEKFPVSEEVKPGFLVAIDPQNPGQLCLARGAYNRCVAGVVSGANDLSAGAILGHLPGHEDAPPIALSGRVWVHCDAGTQPIVPGDLLTTSDMPGYAMKVTDYARGQGAVIGKAMTALDSGQGLVLVLVSLQ